MSTRPLGIISDFVVTLLPSMLEAGRLSHCLDDLLIQTGSFHVPQDREDLLLARLDLKMLEAALVFSGGSVPDALKSMIDNLCGSEPKGLLYEEIVLANPKNDPRHFTTSPVSKTETAFYFGHQDIEAELQAAILQVDCAIKMLSGQSTLANAVQTMCGINHHLEAVVTITEKLGAMDPEHFTCFRRYLGSSPYRNEKGPSGAFSPGIPLLEVKLFGGIIPESYRQYLVSNAIYFPTEPFKAVLDGLQKDSLVKCWQDRGKPEEITTCIKCIADFLVSFRSTHLGAVKRQIPQAIDGKLSGTAGELNPGAFLRARRDETIWIIHSIFNKGI